MIRKTYYIVAQIYVDDIIFGATNLKLCKEFAIYVGRICDEYEGRTKILYWFANQTIKGWDLSSSREI